MKVTILNMSLAGQRMVSRFGAAEFDANGRATVSKEAADALVQLPGYSICGVGVEEENDKKVEKYEDGVDGEDENDDEEEEEEEADEAYDELYGEEDEVEIPKKSSKKASKKTKPGKKQRGR